MQKRKNREEAIQQAARLLRQGKLVAIPTETVYGLGANGLEARAVQKIYAAKGRPTDNPLILHIASMEMLYQVVSAVPEPAMRLAKRFWPGPLTMVLPKSELVPEEVSRGLPTVAVRWPSHAMAQAVILAAGVPVAAPSANLSGCPSPTTAEHVKQDLAGRIDYILDGGSCQMGVESTVISLVESPPRLLRPGSVTVEQLQEVLGDIKVDKGVLAMLEEGRIAASPGMKHKHYAPKCKVILLNSDEAAYIGYVNGQMNHGVHIAALCYQEERPYLLCDCVVLGPKKDKSMQGMRLFQCLRELDAIGAEVAYAHLPQSTGLGLALQNRMLRAANFEVISLMGKGNQAYAE